MTNISGKVDNIYGSIITSKHNIDSPQKHEETDFSDNCHLIKSQTEMIKNLTRKLEDSQSQQHKEARYEYFILHSRKFKINFKFYQLIFSLIIHYSRYLCYEMPQD